MEKTKKEVIDVAGTDVLCYTHTDGRVFLFQADVAKYLRSVSATIDEKYDEPHVNRLLEDMAKILEEKR